MATKQSSNRQHTVCILGGGLAGLVTALELVKRGISVDIYERSGHFGGKAASLDNNLIYDSAFNELAPAQYKEISHIRSDHGYHVFPKWYTNMRELWNDIDLDPETEVFEGRDYLRLQRGTDYNFKPAAKMSTIKRLCILDLVTRSDDQVDDISCRAFFYSRLYNPKDSVSLNELFLNALSIAEYDISARVVRDLFRQWLPVYEEPNWDALKGDLNSVLIDKIVAKIDKTAKEKGCKFNKLLQHELSGIDFIGEEPQLTIKNLTNGKPIQVSKVPMVMALPMEVLRAMQNDELFEREPNISKLSYLRANQYPALDIYYHKKLENITPEHFELEFSKYNLTAFDASQQWPEFRGRNAWQGTMLQFVAGSCQTLAGLSSKKLTQQLYNEISHYIPHTNENDVAYIVAHPNRELPLFVNDVNTWTKRPSAKGNVFYFAGDYCQHETDITSMEGAVRSGLSAAEAVRLDLCPNKPAVNIKAPIQMSKDALDEARKSVMFNYKGAGKYSSAA